MLIKLFETVGVMDFRILLNLGLIYLLLASIYKLKIKEKISNVSFDKIFSSDIFDKIFSNNNIILVLILIYLSMIGYYWNIYGSELALTFATAVGTIAGPIVAYLIFIKYHYEKEKEKEEKRIQNWYKKIIIHLKDLKPERFNPKFFDSTCLVYSPPKYLKNPSDDFLPEEISKFNHFAQPEKEPEEIQKEVKEKINDIYDNLENLIKDAPEGADYKIYSYLFIIIDIDEEQLEEISRGYCETIYKLWIKLQDKADYKGENS